MHMMCCVVSVYFFSKSMETYASTARAGEPFQNIFCQDR